MVIKDPHSDHDGDDSDVSQNMLAHKATGHTMGKSMDKNGYK